MSDVTASALADALRDRYRLQRELGSGGMATVYLAWDLKHDRPVALKVLRPELSAILGSERFLREVQLTAKLQHPHILTLIDSGEAAGLLYYVMPYVEGESLRVRLQRQGQLSLDETLRIARAVAVALDYAHTQGVIHRDIKPENILLHQGEAVVADFGIALAVSSAGRERLTETGLSLGTPFYMSPEQASATPRLDGRSDQYSLACVVYEMLAGEPPYTGATAQAIIAKRLSEPVPHLNTLRQVPSAVDLAVRRALARSPADRFATVGDFTGALELTEPPRLITPRRAAVLGAVAAVAALALVAFFLRPVSVPYRPMTQRQFTFTGKVIEPEISPDGQQVAYISGWRSLMVQPLAGGPALVLIAPARFMGTPRWTPDGSTILFTMFRDSTELAATYAVSSRGGSARKILEDVAPFDTGHDSSTVVRAPRLRHQLEVMNWQTGELLRSLALPDSLGEVTQVEWAPDLSFIAFTAGSTIWTIPAGGGEPRRIAEGRSVRWVPGSVGLYYLAGDMGAVTVQRAAIDRATGRVRGTARQIASLPTSQMFDVAADGRLILVQGSTSAQARALVLEKVDPRRIAEDRFLTEGTAVVTSVTISEDGGTVAYGQLAGGSEDLYRMPFAGGGATPLTATPVVETRPTWSPGGHWLGFLRAEPGGTAAMMLDDKGATRRIGSEPVGSYYSTLIGPAWSADGRFVAYYGREARRVVIADLSRQRDHTVEIPDSIGTGYLGLALSPDGSQLLLSTIRLITDWGELWVTDATGSSWTRLGGPFGESFPIRWAKDGWLYLLNHRALQTDYGAIRTEIWRMRGVTGSPQFYALLPEGCLWTDLSADGSRVVCVSEQTTADLYLATDFDPDLR